MQGFANRKLSINRSIFCYWPGTREEHAMSTRLERLVHMDAMIRSGSYPSVKTFCERFEVSKSTVYGDVRFLKDRLCAPLEHSHARGGYFYTDPTWVLPSQMVTEGQLLAFFLSIELAHRYLGTSFEQPLREVIQHLTSTLPAKVPVTISELASHYSVRTAATFAATPETLLALHDAIQKRHPVEIIYFTATRGVETQRIVHPYHLVNMLGEWHLIAYDRFRERVIQFAVPRIRSWRALTSERFEVDPNFSSEQYLSQSFQFEHGNEPVEIVIQFDAYQARYIRERRWEIPVQIEERPDGGLILRFTTGGLGAVQRWVMGYGSHARVLAPVDLARSVASEFRAALGNYADLQ
jgi:predicted DNA-binding transcriptional regulator YafY